MCQLCDEADAYVAQLEAAPKKDADAVRKVSRDDRPAHGEPPINQAKSGKSLKKIAPKARVY